MTRDMILIQLYEPVHCGNLEQWRSFLQTLTEPPEWSDCTSRSEQRTC